MTIASTVAPRPPMGWNSWNCFGVDVEESAVRAVTDYMATRLRGFGWEYVVVDAGWYLEAGVTTANFKQPRPPQRIDAWGRLVPAEHKFPSAANGAGFRPLADYVHARGLKFGLHIMRGIPWQAVEADAPVLGSTLRAGEIANAQDGCIWYQGMQGIRAVGGGALAYYRSLVALYAEWGVDFVKADDMSYPYHRGEIEALGQAVRESPRPMVLSLSPGPAPLDETAHLRTHAHLWRISPDFWDDWRLLKRQFSLCRAWQAEVRPGGWPDCDMLPLGRLRITGPDDYSVGEMGLSASEITDEFSRFTVAEKHTMFTLWCLFRSPLFAGGYLPDNDPLTQGFLTHAELLALNQQGSGGREVFYDKRVSIWLAANRERGADYVAIFNLQDHEVCTQVVQPAAFGLRPAAVAQDVWSQELLPADAQGDFAVEVAPHDVRLLRFAAK